MTGKPKTFMVAIGDGFSGDTIHVSAMDEQDAAEIGQMEIDKLGNTGWRVLGVKPA